MTLKKFAYLASFSCLTAPVFAQEAPAVSPPAAEAEKEELIIVTGSRIKRAPLDSSLPLQIISNVEIEREGISSAEQLVSLLSTNGSGADNLASNSDVTTGAQRGTNGVSSANLRGQGSGATLVLLNGRRIASHGLSGGQIDVNQIPLAAIDRVEILKDGASAIYGTDAIGGVINYILRKNVTGFSVTSFADVTEQGGGNIYKATATGGWGDLDKDGFNLMAAASYSENKALRSNQRDFVNTFQPLRGLSPDTRGTPFATIVPLVGTVIASTATAPFIPGSTTVRSGGGINTLDLPGAAGCSSIAGMGPYDHLLWNSPTAALACAYDTGRAGVIQQPLETFSFVSRGMVRVGDHEFSAEITGSRAEAAKRFSELQLTPNTTTQQLRYPRTAANAATYDRIAAELRAAFPTDTALAANLTAQLPFSYRWRCIECGVREINTTTKTGRAFVGAEGPVGWGWDYNAGASYAFSESESLLGSGYYYRGTTATGANDPLLPNGGIIQALNSGNINIFLRPGETQSAAGLAALQAASAEGVKLFGGKYEVTQIDGSVAGPLFSLPGGTVQAAVGVDYRKEQYSFNGDARDAAARPTILAAPFDDVNALTGKSRTIKAVYAELLFPIFEGFDITGAIRRDDYTGFGTTTNPKISFKYRPVDKFMFRGSYNTGFRVPSFNQIFNGITISPFTGADLADPLTCAARVVSALPGCTAINPSIATGGNLLLGPEEAKQFGFGFVFEPSPHFSASFDWWNIDRTGTITTLSIQELVANFNLFADRFIRATPTGPVVSINRTLINAGASKTQGIEITLRATGDVGEGTWSAGIDGTYLLEKTSQLTPNVPFSTSEIGKFSLAGDLGLRWKHNAFISYKIGDWGFSLSQIFRSGYTNQELPGVTNGTVTPPGLDKKVNAYVTHNISVNYEVLKGLKVTAGVKNIFDADPPFAITYDTNTGAGSSWEPRVADPRGRAYTLLVAYKF